MTANQPKVEVVMKNDEQQPQVERDVPFSLAAVAALPSRLQPIFEELKQRLIKDADGALFSQEESSRRSYEFVKLASRSQM